jgi:zinc transport system substrate-binding protein
LRWPPTAALKLFLAKLFIAYWRFIRIFAFTRVRIDMKLIHGLLFIACCVAVGACKADDSDSRPVLAVSIEPQRYILEQIVGDDYRITVMMPNGENPETFEPSMSKHIDVANAQAYFTIGNLPFETTIAASSPTGLNIVCTSQGIVPVYGTHAHAHAHTDGATDHTADPHFWVSVANARTMARNMLQAILELKPDSAQVYIDRFNRYDAHLDSLNQTFASRLSNIPSKAFLVWHPSLSYFARDYSLEQIAIGQENKDASLSALRSTIDEARADSVKVFFYQRDLDDRQAETINAEIGSRLIPILPTSYQWEQQLTNIVDELTRQ